MTIEQRQKKQDAQRESLIKRCNEIITATSYCGLTGHFQENASNQAKLIRDSLVAKHSNVFHCICARFGWTSSGDGYINAEVVNTQGNTERIVLARESKGSEEILLIYDLAITERKSVIFSIEYLEGQFVGLDSISRNPKGSTVTIQSVRQDANLELPSIQDLELNTVLYCEDHDGRRTNSVPIQRFDFGEPKVTHKK